MLPKRLVNAVLCRMSIIEPRSDCVYGIRRMWREYNGGEPVFSWCGFREFVLECMLPKYLNSHVDTRFTLEFGNSIRIRWWRSFGKLVWMSRICSSDRCHYVTSPMGIRTGFGFAG